MEIPKFTVDTNRRLAILRDRVSKVRPAQAMFEQLIQRHPEVMIELEFLDASRSSSTDWGLRLPTSVPLVYFGGFMNSLPSIPSGFLQFLTFGGGKTLMGLGVTNAEIFATMTRSTATTLMKAQMRSSDGQAATFHIGDKFPIITSGYFGPIEGEGTVYRPPPTFNFEDLGFVMKITPRIHGTDEVTLDVDASFKVLTGDSLNGIPVIASRTFKSVIRIRQGEMAVMAGLMTSQEARSITGIAGLMNLPILGPLLRENHNSKNSGENLILLRPHLLNIPPTELETRPIYTGTESRPASQL
jgi:general secretion pathway protein D